MSIPVLPSPPPRIRPLPRGFVRSAAHRHAVSEQFLKLQTRELLTGLADAEMNAIRFYYGRYWQQARQAVAAGCYTPELRADLPYPQSFQLVLYCAAALGEPVARALFWLETLEQPETAEELKAIARWHWNFDEPKPSADKLAAASSEQRREIAASATSCLRFLALQAGHPDSAGTLTLTAAGGTGSDGPPPASAWQLFKWGFGFFFRGPRWAFDNQPVGKPRRPRLNQVQAAWSAFVQEGQAPAEPLEGYRLLVAEKQVDGETISFGCAGYRFSAGQWHRLRSLHLPELDSLPASFTTTVTPIEQLTGAWADWTHAVGQLNERRYQTMLAADRAAEAKRQAEQWEASAQREQLRSSAEIAELLPGPTMLSQPGRCPSRV